MDNARLPNTLIHLLQWIALHLLAGLFPPCPRRLVARGPKNLLAVSLTTLTRIALNALAARPPAFVASRLNRVAATVGRHTAECRSERQSTPDVDSDAPDDHEAKACLLQRTDETPALEERLDARERVIVEELA